MSASPISRLPSEGAAQAAHAADDDDDEGGNEDVGIHAGIDAEDRPRRDAAQRRQRDAADEHAGEERRDVAAEPGRHRRSSTPARTIAPSRLRSSNSHSTSATASRAR